jgi:hypothetical protein
MRTTVDTKATMRRLVLGAVPALGFVLLSAVALAQGSGSSGGAGGTASPGAGTQAGPSASPGAPGALPTPAHRQPRPADVNRSLQGTGGPPDPAAETEQRLEGSSRRAINSICRGC